MNSPVSYTDPNLPLSAATIQTWLVQHLADQLGIEPSGVDGHTPLMDYGLDSAQALSLISEGEKMLGCEISPMLLWHYPTLATLSQRLAEEVNESDTETFEL